MEICPECGRPIRGNGVYAGPHWNRRHYCSNSCCRSGERNLSQDDVVEDNRGCLYRFFRPHQIVNSHAEIVGNLLQPIIWNSPFFQLPDVTIGKSAFSFQFRNRYFSFLAHRFHSLDSVHVILRI